MRPIRIKINVPKAVREQVWIKYFDKKFEHKCFINWCNNIINVFDFHVGHNIPNSKGGSVKITNLRPICSRCNLSMGDRYSIDEWMEFGEKN
jgi:5-methylcytosine-specific restriction endonuclease McrA